MTRTINLALQFSRFPGGRYLADGPDSGERFRVEHLVPALETSEVLVVKLDGTLGYGSSFLEEAFGGLVRNHNFNPDKLRRTLKLESSDESISIEIWRYIEEAEKAKVGVE